jgi:hypothetical protein
MKAVRKILLALSAAGLGYILGIPGAETRDRQRNEETDRSASGSTKNSNDDAIAATFSALLARGDLRELARVGTLLDALDAAQMRALFDNLDRLSADERGNLLPRLLTYWTKRDPQAATAWIQPHLARFAKDPSFGNMFANFDTDLVAAWAENAPALAIEYARQHAATKLAEILLHNGIFSWPEKNDATRFEVLRTFPAGEARQKVVVSFFFSWAQTDRAAALSAAASLPPGPERDGGLAEVLARWAGSHPAAAFEQAQALGLTAPALLAIMAKEAAKSDPAATARWLETQDATLLSQLGTVVAKFWARQDPAAAFAWAEAQGVSLMDGSAVNARKIDFSTFAGHAMEMGMDSPFSAAMREKPDATLAWVCALPAGPDRDRFLELAIRSGADIEKVRPLLAELPPEAAVRGAAQIAGRLAVKNPAQAQQWAESLPSGPMREEAWASLGAFRTEALPLAPGPYRDAMLRGMASAHATSAPVQALERVMEIGDVALRRRTFDDVFWQLNRGPIDLGHGGWMSGASESALHAARAWLETAKIPEDWKQAWRP